MYVLEIFNGDTKVGGAEFSDEEKLSVAVDALSPSILKDGVTVEVTVTQ